MILPFFGLLLMTMLTFLLSGCLDIVSLDAPNPANLGDDLTYTISMQVETQTPPPNARIPNASDAAPGGWTVGLRIPKGWTVLEVRATDTQTQPVFAEDTRIERIFKKNTGAGKSKIFKPKTNYKWWVGRVDVKDLPDNVKINGTITVKLRPARKIGKFKLDIQTGGYNFQGQLYFNDTGRKLNVPVSIASLPPTPTRTPKFSPTPKIVPPTVNAFTPVVPNTLPTPTTGTG